MNFCQDFGNLMSTVIGSIFKKLLIKMNKLNGFNKVKGKNLVENFFKMMSG